MHKKKGWASTMQINRMKKNKSAGFTLIELLIVIIIIGILAAIAFVAYTGSQNKAKKADAEATLSQSRSKLAEYNSNEGRYPSDKAEFTTWIGGTEGGNNDALATKLGTASFTYTPGPTDCDDDDTCTEYTLTADGDLFSGTDITVNN
jgi:type IV pilus assembly protein PilE